MFQPGMGIEPIDFDFSRVDQMQQMTKTDPISKLFNRFGIGLS